MIRLFAALRPPAAVRAALLLAQGGVDGARWQSDDQLHLTLRFIGEVDERTAADIAAALGCIEAPQFTLDIAGAGLFEGRGRVHSLWAGLAPSPPLAALAAKVERACQAAGLAPEGRRFTPHVTIARVSGAARGAREWVARHADLAAPTWPVATFGLYESRLGKGGSAYDLLAEWPLGSCVGNHSSALA